MARIFISWSKDRSLSFANALQGLMSQVLRIEPPGMASAFGPANPLVALSLDLPKGGSWFQNLAGLLEHARAGIICVTPENCSSPWLLFEAGALIRCDVEVALFPVLLDLPAAALTGPLSLLQATVIERDADAIRRETHELLKRLADHVNGRSPSSPDGTVVVDGPDDAPEAWHQFVTRTLQIPPAAVTSLLDRFTQLFERKTFREPFEDCADQRWLDRYAGARLARDEMQRHQEQMRSSLPPGARLAYERLSAAVDSYAMAIAGLLLTERAFGRDPDGRLTDADGRLAVCERRRLEILAAYTRLRDPVPPVFDDARLYEELSDLQERKVRLIHPLEHRLEAQHADPSAGAAVIEPWALQRAAISPWLYDRLVYYVHAARTQTPPPFEDLLDSLERELNIVEARDAPATLVGLYYALEAIETHLTGSVDRTRFEDLLVRIDARIEDWNRPPDTTPRDRVDANGKIRRKVQRLRQVQ